MELKNWKLATLSLNYLTEKSAMESIEGVISNSSDETGNSTFRIFVTPSNQNIVVMAKTQDLLDDALTAIILFPAIKSAFCDAKLAADLGDSSACFMLLNNCHDLFD